MTTALLVAVFVLFVVVVILFTVNGAIREDRADHVRWSDEAVRDERDRRKKAEEGRIAANRKADQLTRERDFWRGEAVRLGYPAADESPEN